ncbi:MAG: hypothetical protein JSS49_22470 [Planctomycetes bacterium]|nr:hypothetical protein [Planctomycetota bacterium]
MRLKFVKERFALSRTHAAGEVAEVPDELAESLIKEGDAVETSDDLTPIPEPDPFNGTGTGTPNGIVGNPDEKKSKKK